MYACDADNLLSITEINRNFSKSEISWTRQQNKIKDHLLKADIVSLDFRHINTDNQMKILKFLLSLPETD